MSTTERSQPEAYLCARDGALARLIDEYGPCPLIAERGDPIYTLFTAIMGQQISAKVASRIRARFMDHFGKDTGSWVVQLLDTTEDRLRQFGLSRNKASSIKQLAGAFANGDFDLSEIAQLSDEHAITELIKFKGIGPWTAEMFLLFGLRRLDTATLRDAGLRRGVHRAYGFTDLPTDRELTALFDTWRPYRGVGCWYMWRVLD